ncbi:MAG TPA: GNAT family N-acetyltransferase [Acidimicrobiales bacterium]|nr:GNAT family N-acetyltransferase [Acidimicrobiales bacterium]
MDIEIRPVVEDEYPQYARRVARAFGEHLSDEGLAAWREAAEPDRTVAAFDAGDIVGTADAWTMELTLPGLATIPAPGVTAVGVLSTHRRRGVLTRMMADQLDDIAARGEPLAILLASESLIYGRFGYGWATSAAEVAIDTAYSSFTRPVEAGGRMRVVDAEAAAKLLPPVHDRIRRRQPGDVNRPPGWWHVVLADLPERRKGHSAFFFALHESAAGEPDGFVAYRIKEAWNSELPASELLVVDLMGETPEVEAALWRFVFDVDLVATVHALIAPGDPIRRRLAEPRRLRVDAVTDHIWVRLLDIPTALSARAYGTDGEVVLEVTDPFRPANDGCYLVSAAGGARRITGRDADIALGVDDLGSAYLGGVRLSTLAAAGRAHELRPGALARADALFAPVGTEPEPFCHSDF